MEQDYAKLLWEYKQVLEEQPRKQQQSNECVIESDDDEDVKEQTSQWAMQMISTHKMY